jgi:hypothetical protein
MKANKLFAVAVLLWLAFLAVHALGLRESVPALSLTHPANKSFERAVMEMALYVLAYFGATLAAPILALSAALQLGYEKLTSSSAARGSRTRPAAGP